MQETQIIEQPVPIVLEQASTTPETIEECLDEIRKIKPQIMDASMQSVQYGKLAIRHAVKMGKVLIRAKEILPHGKFVTWIEENTGMHRATATRLMKLSNVAHMQHLKDDPSLKSLTQAYRVVGILPEPTPSPATDSSPRPAFTFAFKTTYKSPDEWTSEAALDFLYEFDQLKPLAVELRSKFGEALSN